LGLFALAGSLLTAFVLIERRAREPLMPLRLLTHPTLAPAMAVVGLFGAGFGAQYFLLTTYLQDVRHYTPSQAGLAFLPFALAIVAGTRIGGKLPARVGLRNGLILSLLTGVAGQVLIAVTLASGGSYALHVFPGFVLDGLGQGSAWTLMWIAATSGIAPSDRGVASGMASSAQQIGAALGLALLVGLATTVTASTTGDATSALVAGLRLAFFAASTIAGVAAVVVLRHVAPRGRNMPSKLPADL
jgi:predicted MFS family arabinose efflux permease